jgi:hypothetical protein
MPSTPQHALIGLTCPGLSDRPVSYIELDPNSTQLQQQKAQLPQQEVTAVRLLAVDIRTLRAASLRSIATDS